MDMAGQQRIAASREIVWKALNDPAVLEACIPGCQELVKLSDTRMTATARIKVGPVTAKFQGAVTLSDLDPPNGYRIAGEGQGGIAGFAKGSAIVRLEQDGDSTILHYDVSAQVGGKLSQLGSRLIDATAKQMSGLFFKRFAEEIAAQYCSDARADDQLNANSISPKRASAARNASAPTSSGQFRASGPAGVTPDAFRRHKSVAVVLLLAAMAMGWYLSGGALPSLRPDAGANVSADFGSGLLLIIVAAVGYLLGRQQSHVTSGTLRIDRDVIDQLAQACSERRK